MALKLFFFISLILSLLFYYSPIESSVSGNEKENRPIFIFENPVMYTLNEMGVTKKIISTQAVRYKNKDEIYFANIEIFNKDSKKNYYKDSLKAEFIEKKGEKYYLANSVKFKRDNFIEFNTDELYFDNIKKIARNKAPFNALYYENFYSGTNLYFDINKNYIKSRRTQFIIEKN